MVKDPYDPDALLVQVIAGGLRVSSPAGKEFREDTLLCDVTLEPIGDHAVVGDELVFRFHVGAKLDARRLVTACRKMQLIGRLDPKRVSKCEVDKSGDMIVAFRADQRNGRLPHEPLVRRLVSAAFQTV